MGREMPSFAAARLIFDPSIEFGRSLVYIPMGNEGHGGQDALGMSLETVFGSPICIQGHDLFYFLE
jgi:hypothetical protein